MLALGIGLYREFWMRLNIRLMIMNGDMGRPIVVTLTETLSWLLKWEIEWTALKDRWEFMAACWQSLDQEPSYRCQTTADHRFIAQHRTLVARCRARQAQITKYRSLLPTIPCWKRTKMTAWSSSRKAKQKTKRRMESRIVRRSSRSSEATTFKWEENQKICLSQGLRQVTATFHRWSLFRNNSNTFVKALIKAID